jgi:hypothetical protein
MFYYFDKQTKKRQSLHTTNEDEAKQIIEAKNNAERQPVLNLQIAKAYLAGSDSGINTRTWQDALKRGANKERWQRAVHDKALDLIRNRPIIETKGESLFKVLHAGTVSANVFLRQLHNFCVDMNWLPWHLIPKRQCPLRVGGTSEDGRVSRALCAIGAGAQQQGGSALRWEAPENAAGSC